jgi:hypothetical protein
VKGDPWNQAGLDVGGSADLVKSLGSIEIDTSRSLAGRTWLTATVRSHLEAVATFAAGESMWGFFNSRPVPSTGERDVYRDILTGARFGWTEAQSDSFRRFIRNGLIHHAETRHRWLVERTIPRNAVMEQNTHGDHVLNRTKSHNALKGAFEDWIAKLHAGDQTLRDNMRRRMNRIIQKHYQD